MGVGTIGRRLAGWGLAALLSWPVAALADLNAGVEALKRQDYSTAFSEFKQAADAGDARAYGMIGSFYESGKGVQQDFAAAADWYRRGAEAGNAFSMAQLARFYAQGRGIARDLAEAKRWAGRAADKGDADGHLWVYVLAVMTDLSFIGPDGKPDPARYRILSSRPIAERTVEIDAYEHLAKAAAKGNPTALNFYLAYLMEHVAPGNGKRFQAVYSAPSSATIQWVPAVRNAASVLALMDKLGPTLASPKIFTDAQTTAVLAALFEYGARHGEMDETQKQNCLKTIRPLRLEVSRPLQDAEWMPFQDEMLKQTYLVKGNWAEKWAYGVCGEEIPLEMVFSADGLGGAHFTISTRKPPAFKPSTASGGL